MLVLSRKIDEKIILARKDAAPITLTIVKIDKNKVRIGIEADGEVTILRAELTEERRFEEPRIAAKMAI
jgi:carbon storage regulator CsrA